MLHSRVVLQVWQDIEKSCDLLKSVNFVFTKHQKEPKLWLLPLETTFNHKTWNLFKVLNIEIS